METPAPDMMTICTSLQNQIIKGDIVAMRSYIDESILLFNERVLPAINKVLSRPSNIRLLISCLLGNQVAFETVRKNSYCHENGFHKIVLLQGEHFKLRLHHFGTTGKAAMENVHDHRWPFASTILKGDLLMEFFEPDEETESGELLLHYVYNSDKSTGAYKADIQGVTNLKMVKKVLMQQGTGYLLLPDALHRIVNKENQESITLILTGKPVSHKCNLYSRRLIADEEKQTPAYEAHSLRQQLQQISEMIYPHNN